MSSLTKEQLKNELINHGVTLPAANARKEEYVKLYEQHVAPVSNAKGDFSSDEEDTQPKVVSASNEDRVVVDGLDVAALSDDELYQKLKELGVPVGPVVDSTRAFYQRKLATVLSSQTPAEPKTNGQSNGDQVKDEEFSDSSDVEEIIPEEDSIDAAPPQIPVELEPVVEEPLTAVRKRVLGGDHPAASLSAQPLVDRQGTPTPRPSIRSVTSTAPTTYSYKPRLLSSDVPARTQPIPSKQRSYRVIYIIVLLALAAVAAYFAFQYLDKAVIEQQFEKAKNSVKSLFSEVKHVAEEVDHAQANPTPEV